MQVYFWGTRGSLPAKLKQEEIEDKIFYSLKKANGIRFKNDQEIRSFIDNDLSFDLKGTFGCNTSCVEIMGEDEYVVCDAGSGLRDFGNYIMNKGPQGKKVINIIMSHFHYDHINGFPFFVPAYVPGYTVNIYGIHKELEKAFVNHQIEPYFPVPMSVMQSNINFILMEPDKVYNIGGFEVKGTKQNHPGISYGYSFEKNGKKVIYSTDAEHVEASLKGDYHIIKFFDNSDLLIFDAQYNLADHFFFKKNWGHSSNLVGVELSVRSKVKKLALFHHEHTLNDYQLLKSLSDTKQYLEIYDSKSDLEILMSYDGLLLKV